MTPGPLTPEEIASGLVTGPVPTRPAQIGEPGRAGTVLDRMSELLRPALARSPCLVSFSGGMDSSFVLAAATHAARRDGLPDPVPIIWRFVDAPAADETDRQTRVIGALGLAEPIVLTAGDDLDLLGPVATDFLDRFGLRFPANLYVHLPLVAAAGAGALLTGVGGDQVLCGHRDRPPALRRAFSALPPALLAPAVRHRADHFPWLTPAASRRSTARWLAHRPPRAGVARMHHRTTDRGMALGVAAFTDMAIDTGTLVMHPFLDPGVQAAFGALVERRPAARRPELLAAASGPLPEVIAAPHPKARFHQAFVRAATARFIRRPADPALLPPGVDPARLQRFWCEHPDSTATALLIQHLWLRQRRRVR